MNGISPFESSASSSTSCSTLVFSLCLLSRASHGGGEMAKVGLCVVYLVPSLAKIKKEAATRRERRNDEHASEKIKKKQKKFPKDDKTAQ